MEEGRGAGPPQISIPSAPASPFTYHPEPVSEPAPSHPFPPSSCASPFTYPSTYSLKGEPGPCLHIACMSPYQSHVQAQHLHEPLLQQQICSRYYSCPILCSSVFTSKTLYFEASNSHIKVCAGRRNGFCNPDSSLPGSPYDVCSCHKEPWRYTRPKTRQLATV